MHFICHKMMSLSCSSQLFNVLLKPLPMDPGNLFNESYCNPREHAQRFRFVPFCAPSSRRAMPSDHSALSRSLACNGEPAGAAVRSQALACVLSGHMQEVTHLLPPAFLPCPGAPWQAQGSASACTPCPHPAHIEPRQTCRARLDSLRSEPKTRSQALSPACTTLDAQHTQQPQGCTPSWLGLSPHTFSFKRVFTASPSRVSFSGP